MCSLCPPPGDKGVLDDKVAPRRALRQVVLAPDRATRRPYVANPMTRSTIATNGKVPCVTAARALSGDDVSSTTAAASIDPAPANTSATPTALDPVNTPSTPTTVTIARNKL